MKHFDIVIIGSGPAGMAAALEAGEAGLSTLVLDEQEAPGGQVHRAIEARTPASDDDRDGAALVAAFRASSTMHWHGSAVWQVERAGDDCYWVYLSRSGVAERITARQLILATGATERPVPIAGWTLPGVMTVGAAQILLKTGGNVPAGNVIVAGQGPLPLLYATQLLKAGVRPAALLDTTPRGAIRRAMPHLAGALASPAMLAKGLGYMATVHRAGIPVLRGITDVAALGTDRLTGVRYRRGDQEAEIQADLLLLHEGVVPHTHLAMSLGVAHDWDEAQLCWRPALGEDGGTSLPGLRIAGDGGGIGGWRKAVVDGRLAGLAAAVGLGAKVDPTRQASLRHKRAGLARFRPFLDAWYRPRASLLAPVDDIIVCRCEERTAGELRAAIRQGCLGPNQVKSFTRCGMGPCQGRACGLTLTTLVAAERGITPAEAGALRIRPPLKPLTLGELAALAPDG